MAVAIYFKAFYHTNAWNDAGKRIDLTQLECFSYTRRILVGNSRLSDLKPEALKTTRMKLVNQLRVRLLALIDMIKLIEKLIMQIKL